MDFIINNLLPVLRTTAIGLALIIILFLIVIILTVLTHIKDYKEIKTNLIELKNDIRNNFLGIHNKKNRLAFVGIVSIFFIASFTISSTYMHIRKPKQVTIEFPKNNAILNVEEETLIEWNQIPNTVEYFVSIYPASPGFHNPFEQNQFYVDGNYSGVKLVLNKYVHGTGRYRICVSSDAPNTKAGTVTVKLIDNTPQIDQSEKSDET